LIITERLTCLSPLQESLPIEANIALPLAKLLAEKSPGIPITVKCNVTSFFYTGDMGGIICGVDIGGPNTETRILFRLVIRPSTDAFNHAQKTAGSGATFAYSGF
jgi:hypothetical protein